MKAHPKKRIESPLTVPELLARAEQGDADCQYWAGVRFFQGEGVPKDQEKAVELCAEAASQFHVRAIAFIAYCRFNGVVVPKDVKGATLLYRFAADEGYPPAQHTLGNLYLTGNGVRKNVRLAIKWLSRAAAQGNPDALVRLGDIYHEGRDVVEDGEKAFGYYRQAAELGTPAGQFMSGSYLMKGIAVERNPVAALELLDQAASQGYRQALEVREHFEEFVHFDPAEAQLQPLPLTHSLPLRRRTAVTMAFLRRPCYQAMARDLYEYAREHPDDTEVALRDAAVLLEAAAEAGEPSVAFIP